MDKTKGWHIIFSIEGQVISILGFVGHMGSLLRVLLNFS